MFLFDQLQNFDLFHLRITMDYAEVKKINKMTFKLMKAARDAVANGTRTYSVT